MSQPNDLYGLQLDRFIAERNALAKALRADGNKDEATRVAALRKPSVAAWTVNQLVRTQGSAIASLYDAGDDLQRAQSDLVAGRGDPRALRDATRREREAVDELAEIARGLLSSDGQEPTQATLDRVGETLRAAALSEAARNEVTGGCLERELRQVGFGPGGGGDSGRAGVVGRERGAGRERGSRGGAAGAERGSRAGAAERERAEAAERERAEALKSARRAEVAARRTAEQAARQAESAQARRDGAAAALSEADEALAAARERSEAAANALRQARDVVEKL